MNFYITIVIYLFISLIYNIYKLGNFNKAWYKRVEVESTNSENILNDLFFLKKKKENTYLDSSGSDCEGINIIIYIPGK